MKGASNSSTALLSGLASVVVFLWLHPQILTYLDSRFIGGAFGDGGLYVWLTKLFILDPWKALRFETNAFYPYPISRAWSDSFLLPSLLVGLLAWLGVQLPVAYNTTLLSALTLNGVASALLAITLGLRPIGSFAAGIMVANSAYFIGNLGHPQLLFFFWIPLAWSAALGSRGALRVASRRWLYAGLCVSGAFYSAVYYAIFASIGLAVIWLARLFSGQVSQRRALRTLMLTTIGASPVIYALRYYLSVQSYFGERGVYEATAFAASGLSYLAFPPFNALFGHTASLTHSEAFLCPGYVVLCVALVAGIIGLWKRSRLIVGLLIPSAVALGFFSSIVDTSMTSEYVICLATWLVLLLGLAGACATRSSLSILGAIAALFFVLSFGPGGDPTKHEPVFAPFGVLYSLVPGLGSIRAVSRFGSVAILSLIIGAVYACLTWTASRPRFTTLLVAILTGVTLAESAVPTVPLDSIPTAPLAFDLLSRKRVDNQAALVLPFGGAVDGRTVHSWSEIAILSSQYAQWATDANLTIVNGYSGQRTKLQHELARFTRDFPSLEAFEYLARVCGLRWIIVTPSLLSSGSEESFMRRLEQLSAYTSEVTISVDRSVLIKLADKPIGIPSESAPESLVLFAPAYIQPRVKIPPLEARQASENSGACVITTEIPGKSGVSDRITFPLPEAGFDGIPPSYDPSRGPLSYRGSRDLAVPTLIKVFASSCAPRISCDPG
jgi:hypothetical protein